MKNLFGHWPFVKLFAAVTFVFLIVGRFKFAFVSPVTQVLTVMLKRLLTLENSSSFNGYLKLSSFNPQSIEFEKKIMVFRLSGLVEQGRMCRQMLLVHFSSIGN